MQTASVSPLHPHLERSVSESPAALPLRLYSREVAAGGVTTAGLHRVGHRNFGADALVCIPAPSLSVPQFPHLRSV